MREIKFKAPKTEADAKYLIEFLKANNIRWNGYDELTVESILCAKYLFVEKSEVRNGLALFRGSSHSTYRESKNEEVNIQYLIGESEIQTPCVDLWG